MTVKELIEELKKYPEDMKVVTTDYESGTNEADLVKVIKYRETNWKTYSSYEVVEIDALQIS